MSEEIEIKGSPSEVIAGSIELIIQRGGFVEEIKVVRQDEKVVGVNLRF